MSEHGHRRSRCRRVILAALSLAGSGLVLSGSEPAGAQVPQSAYQGSLGLAPELADYPTLMYELPQAALRFPGQVFGLAVNGYDEFGVGASVHTGPMAWFVLSQRVPFQYGSGYPIYLDAEEQPAFQVGSALQMGSVRAGVALRGQFATRHEDAGPPSNERTFDFRGRQLEVAGGLGAGGHRSRCDVAVALAYREIDIENRLQRESSGTLHESRIFVDSGGDPWVTVSLNGRLPVAAETGLSLAGRWGNRDVEWKTGLSIDDDRERSAFDTWGDVWSAGIALEMKPRHFDWFAISADYRSLREATGARSAAWEEITIIRTTRRQGSFAISAKRRIYRDITGHLGIRKAYTYDRQEVTSIGPEESDVDKERDESLADRFYLGGVGSWKQVQFAGSVNTRLSLSDLFVALDVRIHL